MESRKIPINSTKPPAPADPSADTFEESAEFKVVDKRHFANVDEVAISSGPVEEKPRYPSYVEELMARTAETERRYCGEGEADRSGDCPRKSPPRSGT